MITTLEKLGAKSLSLSAEEKQGFLQKLEKMTDRLPDSYSDLLMHFGCTVSFSGITVFKGDTPSAWADKNGYDDLECLYGFSAQGKAMNIFEAIETYFDDFKNVWIPVGASSGGNQICYCLAGAKRGEVWFWNHEEDPVFDDKEVYSGMTKISSALTDFIGKLKFSEETPPKAIGVYLKIPLVK